MNENLEDICIWKITANNPKSTTFQDIRKKNIYHKCLIGNGRKYCCPDYISLKSISEDVLYTTNETEDKNGMD